MKIAICEDNLTELTAIKKRIESTGMLNDAEYFMYGTAEELIKALDEGLLFDIAFLDVYMPGKSGIEAGNVIREKSDKAIIIFISAYPQYAIDAYDCNAFYYLLKSDCNEKFLSVIKKVSDKYRLLHKFYIAETKNGPVKMELCDIYYVECYKKHLFFHTGKGVYEVRMTLSRAYNELKNYDFYQVHQGYIVNMDKVTGFTENDALLENGDKVAVSIRKRSGAMKAFSEYLERSF